MNDQLSNVRIGNPTSSDIVSLVSKSTKKDSIGAPFFTYVNECRMERFFKQRLEREVEVFAMAWGKVCEKVAHAKMPDQLSYRFQSNNTLEHKTIKGWYGTPDGTKFKEVLKKLKEDATTDFKCPETRKSFYEMIEGLYDFDGVNVTPKKAEDIDFEKVIAAIRKNHKNGEKYYWQLISNACITSCDFAELIVFMPYFEDLQAIRDVNNKLSEPYYSVGSKKDEELPHIIKGSGINDVNIIRFVAPAEDRQFLSMRVQIALEFISMDGKVYDEFSELKINDELEILKFIKEKTGEEIKHVKRAA